MELLISILFAATIFTFGNDWAFAVSDKELLNIKLDQDYKKFETQVNNVIKNLKNLNANDKRFNSVLVAVDLLKNNLFEFYVLCKEKMPHASQNNEVYQLSVHQAYLQFQKDHEKEMKQKPKRSMEENLKLYYSFFRKYRLVISQILVDLHNELEKRTDFASKLAVSLKTKKDLEAIAEKASDALILERGTMFATRHQINNLINIPERIATILEDFLTQLKNTASEGYTLATAWNL
ncbi:uncharacterized protein LOC116341196 [Contarinia nasturtii]|uniref:uncharacterized protein LOC116341196 n=1 Tax=Contarinia nasturtii TaxID=265458 RepID=UPI0012D48AB5|nr:uncharacterized protein LOC116341196 [Contarinia nasturtii]